MCAMRWKRLKISLLEICRQEECSLDWWEQESIYSNLFYRWGNREHMHFIWKSEIVHSVGDWLLSKGSHSWILLPHVTSLSQTVILKHFEYQFCHLKTVYHNIYGVVEIIKWNNKISTIIFRILYIKKLIRVPL